MAVRIRMKKLGRRHRPFYRICAVDVRKPRDGEVIEELGTYDPMVRDTDARVTFNQERISYWLNVGAQPSDKVGVLIKKYGPNGTHLEQMQTARERLAMPKEVPPPPTPAVKKEKPAPAPEPVAEEAATAEGEGGETPAESTE